MKFLNRFLLGWTSALVVSLLSGCSSEEQLGMEGVADATAPLNISVSNSLETKVGGVISGATFPDNSSLGLFLTKEDGSSAYDTDYSNIEYVSSNSGQTWTATTPILLTGTKANVYAYYPYNSSYTDITAIPIDVTQNKDVMWATPATNIYNANPTAPLAMNHALSVIRFSLSKGDYSGAGSIESISIQGDCMAKTGTLNAKTGTVNITDAGAEIGFGTLGTSATLSTMATTVEQLVIPTTTSGPIKVTIKMDGKTFEATSSANVSTEKSKAYKFGLAFSDSKLTMSTVSIGTITEEDQGSMTPIVSNKKEDGVYAIKSDGTLVAYADATDASYDGVAIVMYGRTLQISNSGYETPFWGNTTTDIADIDNLTTVGGGVTRENGYLPQSNGSYNSNASEDEKIKQPYTEWPILGGALADTAGWSHTEALIKEQGSNYIGGATTSFRNAGYKNQGHTDWYVPAAGQLAYMHLKLFEINQLLKKCSGAKQITEFGFMSSSEYGSNSAWNVGLGTGRLYVYNKGNTGSRLLFIRDIH